MTALIQIEFRGYSDYGRSGECRTSNPPSSYWYCYRANIGTTITSFIIGFKLGDYALPMLFIGAVCLFFTKNRLVNNVGRIVFGVGGIFFALNLMSGAMEPLKDLQVFRDYMVQLSKSPILGVFVGSGLTLLIQASSATIGILQNLYASHLIDLKGALPVLFGDNIGTTITAIIASLGANIAAKRGRCPCSL